MISQRVHLHVLGLRLAHHGRPVLTRPSDRLGRSGSCSRRLRVRLFCLQHCKLSLANSIPFSFFSTSYSYVGCYTDQGNPRTLPSWSTTSASMTQESCQQSCTAQGYIYSGTEYGQVKEDEVYFALASLVAQHRLCSPLGMLLRQHHCVHGSGRSGICVLHRLSRQQC